MNFRFYNTEDLQQWEELVTLAPIGTFFHRRSFFAYHKDRFVDRSVIVENDEKKWVAALPLSLNPKDEKQVVSHPGATYGGLLFPKKTRADQVLRIFEKLVNFLCSEGFTSLVYKTVPTHIHNAPSQLDLYALWRIGAQLARRDLWNVIRLDGTRKLSKGRKWGYKKALKAGISCGEFSGDEDYKNFYQMLKSNLEERHDTSPVHSVEEMLHLRNLMPSNVNLWLAKDSQGKCLAGTWVIKVTNQVWHTQYIASTAQGRDECAVDLVLEHLIRIAEEAKCRSFSFGASTEQAGQAINKGLYDFKASFGFGAVVQDFYQLGLRSSES